MVQKETGSLQEMPRDATQEDVIDKGVEGGGPDELRRVPALKDAFETVDDLYELSKAVIKGGDEIKGAGSVSALLDPAARKDTTSDKVRDSHPDIQTEPTQSVSLRIIIQPGKVIANDQGNRKTLFYVAFTDTERLIGEPCKEPGRHQHHLRS